LKRAEELCLFCYGGLKTAKITVLQISITVFKSPKSFTTHWKAIYILYHLSWGSYNKKGGCSQERRSKIRESFACPHSPLSPIAKNFWPIKEYTFTHVPARGEGFGSCGGLARRGRRFALCAMTEELALESWSREARSDWK
jgi:hypothetical protein